MIPRFTPAVQPPYVAPLLELLAEAGPEPGATLHVTVRHDAWCSIFASGPCDCRPEVAMRQEGR